MKFRLPPVHINDEVDVEVIGKGKKEDGVAKIEDYIIFIPGVNVGDKLKVKITKVLPKFAFGEAVGKVTKGAPKAEETAPKPEETAKKPEETAPKPAVEAEKPAEEKPEKPAKKKPAKKAEKKK
jgi:predicted RNA-binding protein with TRAM domain